MLVIIHCFRCLLKVFEDGFESLKEHVCMFWLKDESWSEPNGHVATSSRLESLVSKHSNDLVPCGYIKAVNSTEGAGTTSTMDQIWMVALHITHDIVLNDSQLHTN